MLFLAFSFYPEKHVNANLNGNCYEFLDTAYIKYKNLEMEKEKAVKMLQVQAIGSPSISVPITFSGTNIQVNDFMANNHINETGRQTLGNNNSGIDKTIVSGTILNKKLKKLIEEQGEIKLRKRKNIPLRLCASIMSQQLSVRVAEVIYRRFLDLYGKREPTPKQILDTPHETLRGIGLSNSKANYVKNVARFAIEYGMHERKLSAMTDEEVGMTLGVIPPHDERYKVAAE